MSTAPAPTSNGSATAHRNVVPSEVGWQFVPQYYTFMNKQPDRLHCFYTKQSTFTHGTEGDEVTPCHGQAEIHAKISSLNLQNNKVYIHSVDAQASLGGGILIQVIGEMSHNDGPYHKFVQTFFLAEQTNGYFVLNDVFRYLKEEAVDEDASVADGQEAVVVSDSAPMEDAFTADISGAAGEVFIQAEEEEEEEEPIATNEDFAITSKSPVPEPAPELAAPTPPAAVADDWSENAPAPAVENGITHDEPASPPPAEAEPSPSPVPAPAAPAVNGNQSKPAQPKPAEKPAAAPPAAPAAAPSPPAKPVPKTWANLAAANSNKWGATAASAVATSAAPPPSAQPPTPKTPQRPTSTSNQSQPQQGQQSRHPAVQNAMGIQTAAVFIKGVVDPLSNDMLKAFLSNKFGPLKDIEVVRNKACAFAEFVNVADARRAIVISLPTAQGGEGGVFYRYDDDTPPTRISIETRKERGERPVSSGPARGTGRGGFEGGGRGAPNLEGRGSFRGRGRGRGAPAPKAS